MTDFPLTEEEKTQIRLRLQALEIEHHDLDDVIDRLALDPGQDRLQLQRLKKRKLILKDQIARLRTRLIPDIIAYWQQDDEGRSRTVRITPTVSWRAASNLQLSVNTVVENLTNDTQFYQRFGSAASDTSHYTIARLAQGTRAVTTRISYAATAALSVEWYAQPFVARGQFSDVRELNIPRAANYAQRFRSYADSAVRAAPGGVNFKQFRSNLVTRWEYRPGSVLFLVWSQGRDLFTSEPGTLAVSRDARDLFALPPRNTIAVKASYWYGR